MSVTFCNATRRRPGDIDTNCGGATLLDVRGPALTSAATTLVIAGTADAIVFVDMRPAGKPCRYVDRAAGLSPRPAGPSR
jgi:hypothetical protein